MYASVVGASACIATPASCDLSKGVVADDKAGTVTFHLTQPDPDFLQKLALPFAYVVPAGSPDKEVGTTPLPGTGPYMITDYSPNKSMTLERNPHFKQWSADAQPDGYPDTIEMKIGLSDEDAVTEVEQGSADWVYDPPPADRLGEISDKFPNQIHINATNIQYFMALNTRVAPFDNVDVRRALNYATDRKALIGLFGGERLATPSCQILPPGFPGYQAYCPYTTNPGDTWTAPDMAKAQQLVDQSGTKGQRVVVIATPDETSKSIDLYFVSLLKQLGYDASLKTLNGSVEYSYVQDSRNQAQISYTYWSPDFTAPSNFLAVSVGCDGFHEASTASPNLSEFCDPTIEAKTKQAESTQLTDPSAADALWTAVDHDVTDAAPQITLFTGNKLDFVSERLGNYQYNPSVTGQFMIDQAWVQ
jgi:peptide/nickel transport system substrate-binding protein